jgi:hypothetical protein
MKQYGSQRLWPHQYGHLRPWLKRRTWKQLRKRFQREIQREVTA